MRVLIFGGTGMAGSGVLQSCLVAPLVTEVRAVVRRPLKLEHPKLRPVLHGDFLDYSAIETAFAGVDLCLFCLGISVSQVSGEAEYRRITRDFALAAAQALRAASPGASFHYVSGGSAGLDSRMMWARVKAEAERDLIAGFGAFCVRPAAIDGEPGPSSPLAYRYLRWIYPVFRPFRGLYIRSTDIGLAMLQAAVEGRRGEIVENRELRDLADQARRDPRLAPEPK
jgi:uncharacterized protein YbjT (DUF2867 family)